MNTTLKCGMNKIMNKNIKEIIDLIEDEEFPARRNISDYVISLLYDLNVKKSLIQDVENSFNSEYERRGEQKCFSQTEWKNKLANLWLCKKCREENKSSFDSLGLF